MRHQKTGRKLKRKKDQRKSLLKLLATSFILKGRIKTTKAKADETRKFVERLLTLAKKQNVSSYRLILSRLQNEKAARKLFKEIAPKYLERNGGYTRIIKTSEFKKRDGSDKIILEFIK